MLRGLLLSSVIFVSAAAPAPVTYFNEHAGDGVKWQPWGKAAFDRAQKEQKPIALVVGSFAPHSSRAAHEAMESDPAIVTTLNERFVPVLLDRAEFPAVAVAYAAASDRTETSDVMLYALTPDLEWLAMVTQPSEFQPIATRWKSDGNAFLEEARLQVRKLRARLAENGAPASAGDFTIEQLRALDRSARHDILGGGFFRAAPFFDKNLTEQAILASAFLSSRDEHLAGAGRNALEYAVRDLQMRNGAFNDSQQADSLVPIRGPVMVDGAYYLWDQSEIMHTFGPQVGARLCERFGIGAEKSILRSQRTDPPDAVLAAAIAKMLDIRLKRPMPLRDEPVLESSALMISALARSNDDRYVKAALLAGSYVQRALFDRKTGRLWRRPGVPATAGDYAALVQASIDLYEATLDAKWLAFALDIQNRQEGCVAGSEVPEPVRDFVVTPAALAPLNERAAVNRLRMTAILGRDELPAGVTRVIIFGAPYRADTAALLRAAQSSFDPKRVIVHGGDAKRPPSGNVRIGSLQPLPDGTATAHICRASGCSQALTEPEAVVRALRPGSY